MRLFVITPEDFTVADMPRAVAMLDSGAERLHLRTVGVDERRLRELIESVPLRLRERVSIHEHLHLALEYGLGGVHLNSRSPEVPAGFKGMVSRSCHTLKELAKCRELDYMFLSPVFDSISKRGYGRRFSSEELQRAAACRLLDRRVMALGGVRPKLFRLIEAMGFGGAAMLGAAFSPVDREAFRLQYITPNVDLASTAFCADICGGVMKTLEGGCRWVQLRMKGAPVRDIIRVGTMVSRLCHRFGATFIIDDHAELVKTVDADGVHLGAGDMSIGGARSILGPGYIIGATANTADDIHAAAAAGADYIGLGPLRFTTTKKNLRPTLGYEGYTSLLRLCRSEGITLPVVAIGGIDTDDIAPLGACGVDGVAVSGAIASADDPVAKTRLFADSITKSL